MPISNELIQYAIKQANAHYHNARFEPDGQPREVITSARYAVSLLGLAQPDGSPTLMRLLADLCRHGADVQSLGVLDLTDRSLTQALEELAAWGLRSCLIADPALLPEETARINDSKTALMDVR